MGLFNLFEKEVAYFPGNYSLAFLKPVVNNYKKILKELGIKLAVVEEIDSAGFLIEAGYDKKARKIVKENLEYFKSKGIKKIIVSDPFCFKTFKLDYKAMLPNWDIEVEFISDTILKALENNRKELSEFFNEPIFYYDSCYLSKYLNFYESPRSLLKKMGLNLVEIGIHSEDISCCGSCGNLPLYDLELASTLAYNFIKPIKDRKIKKIVTFDSRAFRHLVLNKLNSPDKENWPELFEASEFLCDSLGIKKEKPIDFVELEKEILNKNDLIIN